MIRAAEPVEGIETMQENRNKKQKNNKTVAESNISNGPSKLCQVIQLSDIRRSNLIFSVKVLCIWRGKAFANHMLRREALCFQENVHLR